MCELLRPQVTAKRARHELIHLNAHFGIIDDVLDHWCRDQAWRDRVEQDAGAESLRRERVTPHPVVDSCLRRCVGVGRLALLGDAHRAGFVSVQHGCFEVCPYLLDRRPRHTTTARAVQR